MVVHPFTTSIHNTKFILFQAKCTGLKFLLLEDVGASKKKFSRFSEFPFAGSFIQQAAKSGTDKDWYNLHSARFKTDTQPPQNLKNLIMDSIRGYSSMQLTKPDLSAI